MSLFSSLLFVSQVTFLGLCHNPKGLCCPRNTTGNSSAFSWLLSFGVPVVRNYFFDAFPSLVTPAMELGITRNNFCPPAFLLPGEIPPCTGVMFRVCPDLQHEISFMWLCPGSHRQEGLLFFLLLHTQVLFYHQYHRGGMWNLLFLHYFSEMLNVSFFCETDKTKLWLYCVWLIFS